MAQILSIIMLCFVDISVHLSKMVCVYFCLHCGARRYDGSGLCLCVNELVANVQANIARQLDIC